MARVPAARTVDREFFRHPPAYRRASGEAETAAIGAEGVEFLLEAFATAGVRGTFFTVSEIAETHPALLERVAAGGHEIASHTHTHPGLSTLSAAERREELLTSKARLEATAGCEVSGFRAPSFDVPSDLLGSLAEAGYDYDSSVVPCRSIPGWYGGEFETRRPGAASAIDPAAPASLTELPVAVMPGLGLPLGGTWLRFFGVRYAILGMRLLARRGIPPVLYVHPWELLDLPEIEGVPSRVYVRSGAYVRRAVERVLEADFEFVTLDELAETVDSRGTVCSAGETD